MNPGIVAAVKEKSQPRFNRSFEYDSLGDRYARFLLEELIPEVSKKYALVAIPMTGHWLVPVQGGICAI